MLDLNQIRRNIILSLAKSGSGHLGGSLGTVEIQALILGKYIQFNREKINQALKLDKSEQLAQAIVLRGDRHKFLLSAGHLAPCYYAVLAQMGELDPLIKQHLQLNTDPSPEARTAYLETLRQVDGDLEGHVSLDHLPFWVDGSTGPLGQGAGTSLGYAWSDIKKRKDHHTFALLGDGECQEGQVWEAAMLAAKLKLKNLTWVIDRNYIQIDGNTEEIGGLDNSNADLNTNGLADKFRAFGWVVHENKQGNDYFTCDTELEKLMSTQRMHSKPGILINYSQVGYPFETFNSYKWHGKTPSAEQAEQALQQLGF
ncbi:MAG: transketolase [Patescibacteria group bacterium]